MITTKVKSNVSFSKLLNDLPKIIDKCLNGAAKDSANLSKSNIDKESGNNVSFPPLSNLTLNFRMRGQFRTGEVLARRRGRTKTVSYPDLEKRTPTNSTKPLKYTGKLYNSIKAKKNKLTMVSYGKQHNDGYKTQAYGVPARPFIETSIDKKTKDTFINDIDKALIK